ncbi:aprataxin and PNK-like factor [Harmonia axyridis]|uniref:aprataxin and PNK-like factor n=1 Tax=Harmonia axyridis TaxID=115357 RepID=UPI001E276399|nr:aprataxin and PNK-like factor [Harmonia axyridis]
MVVLKIFKVDKNDNEKPLCILNVGTHVIGRGSFADCIDKRVSRRHILIDVEDTEVTLTQVHSTPIFFKSSKSPSIKIINKNEPIRLFDGDKFSFIMDTWYTVKIEDDEDYSENSADIKPSTIVISNNVSSSTIVPSTSNTEVSQSTYLKRSAEDVHSNERKKLKLANESLDDLKDNVEQIAVQDDNRNEEDHNQQVEINSTTQVFKKEVISDSDDDSDNSMLPEVTCDIEVREGVQSNIDGNSESTNDVKNNDNTKSLEISNDVKKEPVIENDETQSIKIEPREEIENKPLVKEEDTLQDLGESNQLEQHSSSHDNDDDTSTQTPLVDQNKNESEQNPTDASSSSSGANATNVLRREQCWYGQNCYRKNSSHKEQFSHPGDSDYSENSDDNRPHCPYGGSCYRTNQQHRKDYKHPTSRPAPKPSTSRRGNRRTNTDNHSNMYYDSDSQEEEEDPFAADESSSASSAFDDGETDSDFIEEPDFDDMGDDNEEVKIMFKEAKKFLRKRK